MYMYLNGEKQSLRNFEWDGIPANRKKKYRLGGVYFKGKLNGDSYTSLRNTHIMFLLKL